MLSIRPYPRCIKSSLFAALALAAVAGCHGNVGGNSSTSVSLTWDIFASTDTAMRQSLRCSDVGATSVVLSMQSSTSPTPFVVTFDCASYSGSGNGIPAGTYTATATLYGSANSVLDQPPSAVVTVYRGMDNAVGNVDFIVNLTPAPPPPTPSAATASLSWSVFDISDTTGSQPLNCEDVGGGSVAFTLINSVTSLSYNSSFACSRFSGVTGSVPSGNYNVTLTLYGDPAIYGNATTVLDQVSSSNVVLAGGQNALGTSDFLVNSFVLSWTISAGGIATSCQTVGATQVRLDVRFPGQTQATAYYFPCDNTSWMASQAVYTYATLAIPYGSYTVQWQAYLLDARGAAIGPGTVPMSLNVSTTAQADLGTVHFAP